MEPTLFATAPDSNDDEREGRQIDMRLRELLTKVYSGTTRARVRKKVCSRVRGGNSEKNEKKVTRMKKKRARREEDDYNNMNNNNNKCEKERGENGRKSEGVGDMKKIKAFLYKYTDILKKKINSSCKPKRL